MGSGKHGGKMTFQLNPTQILLTIYHTYYFKVSGIILHTMLKLYLLRSGSPPLGGWRRCVIVARS